MARGGFRPGAGRPKGSAKAKAPKGEAESQPQIKDCVSRTPLEYMLWVMNNASIDEQRRDRMAIAAAPFVHARAGYAGKKEDEKELAKTAANGTEWAGLLQ